MAEATPRNRKLRQPVEPDKEAHEEQKAREAEAQRESSPEQESEDKRAQRIAREAAIEPNPKSRKDKIEVVVQAAKECAIANGKPKSIEALKAAVLDLDPEIGEKLP